MDRHTIKQVSDMCFDHQDPNTCDFYIFYDDHSHIAISDSELLEAVEDYLTKKENERITENLKNLSDALDTWRDNQQPPNIVE